MKVQPYDTVTPEKGEPGHRDVYHQSRCPDGKRILSRNRRLIWLAGRSVAGISRPSSFEGGRTPPWGR